MPRGSRTHTCANKTLQFLHALLIGVDVEKILICDLERKWLKCLLDSVVFRNFLVIYRLQHSSNGLLFL